MAINGKNSIHYTRKDTDTSKSIAVGFKKMKFWHEPTQGDTVIDLNSLTFPSSGVPTNATQPSATELTGAKLLINKDNFTLISSLSGVLDFDSYEITGNMEITLSEGTEEGELFTGIIDHVPRTGLQVLDTVPGVQTFTLTAGSDEVVTSTNFELNAHPTKQIGAVMVFLDGQLMLRNVSNVAAAPAADGNYQELGTGSSGSSIKFNETSGVDREVQIVPTATFNVAPTDTMMALIEKVAGENNKIIPTVAALAGVPESTFTSAPSAVDGANFGQRVVDLETSVGDLEYSTEVHDSASNQWATGAQVRFTKIGNVVTITCSGVNGIPFTGSAPSQTTAAGYIPANYRPTSRIVTTVRNNGASGTMDADLWVYADGTMVFWFSAARSNSVDSFTVSYTVV